MKCPKCPGRMRKKRNSDPAVYLCAACGFWIRKLTVDEMAKVKVLFRRDYFAYWRADGLFSDDDIEFGFNSAWSRGLIRKDVSGIPPSMFFDPA